MLDREFWAVQKWSASMLGTFLYIPWHYVCQFTRKKSSRRFLEKTPKIFIVVYKLISKSSVDFAKVLSQRGRSKTYLTPSPSTGYECKEMSLGLDVYLFLKFHWKFQFCPEKPYDINLKCSSYSCYSKLFRPGWYLLSYEYYNTKKIKYVPSCLLSWQFPAWFMRLICQARKGWFSKDIKERSAIWKKTRLINCSSGPIHLIYLLNGIMKM